jgi:ribosomal protein S18 acetylase RimI-like enzyme
VITVRPIRPGEAALLSSAVKHDPLLHEARAQLQREGRAVYLVAWNDDEPLGHGLLRLPPLPNVPHPQVEDVPQVEDLLVAAGCRSRGIGTRLLGELEQEARKRGFDRISLAVGVTNARARRLYERHGYADASLGEFEIPGAAGGGKPDLCTALVKELAP